MGWKRIKNKVYKNFDSILITLIHYKIKNPESNSGFFYFIVCHSVGISTSIFKKI